MEGETPPTIRKLMVVADPTPQSAAALQYAISHAVLEQDELILVHVENPNSWKNTFSTFLRRPSLSSSSTSYLSEGGIGGGGGGGGGSGGEVDFLEQMKRACEIALPKVRVRSERIEMDGRDKANVIISRSKMLGIDIIIIGQKRSLSSAILGHKRASGSMRGAKAIDTAEFLIENSPCTCVSVQKKGQNGGYLLNTKSHRNFWLLA
ncbi:hypothetical protein SLE2022_054770 [Rubroshorea leprosula]